MAATTPIAPDAYATHLAEVNKTNSVIATEDILNSNGMLLVKKGCAIKSETALRMLNHKLLKPLETSISVADCITGQHLYDDIYNMIARRPDCRAIHTVLKLESTLLTQVQRYSTHDLLVQKMTVLSLRLQREYEKALFCAWFALALARNMRLKPSEIEAAFIAGLAHDTGMLHINPELVDKAGELTAEEWRAVQSHALVSDVFLSHIKKLPEATRRAVREHHERCDGSGYPYGLVESQLSTVGQIVAMADDLHAIQRKGPPYGRGRAALGEILPILQLNSTVHTYRIYAATIDIFRLAQIAGPTPVADSELGQVATQVIQQYKRLSRWFTAVEPLIKHLDPDDPRHPVRTASLMLERIAISVNGSGLFSESLVRWFEHIRDHQLTTAAAEITEAALMYREIQWQMRQLGRVLELVANEKDGLPEPVCQLVHQALAQMAEPKQTESA